MPRAGEQAGLTSPGTCPVLPVPRELPAHLTACPARRHFCCCGGVCRTQGTGCSPAHPAAVTVLLPSPERAALELQDPTVPAVSPAGKAATCRGVCCLPTRQWSHAGLKGQHPKETGAQPPSVAGQLGGQTSLPSCQACHPGRQCCFIRWSLPPLSPKSLELIAMWQCSNSLLQEVLPSLS